MRLEDRKALLRPADTTAVLFVIDGLSGLPDGEDCDTELETARTPHLDRLAREGICGLHEPVAAGVTPGSGPAHLALFGFDPVTHQAGRGVLAALGIGFDLRDGDVAARGNFCTVDDDGIVVDRRAGRLDSDSNRRLCERLAGVEVAGAELAVETVKEYRFLIVLHGDGLHPDIADTDPQRWLDYDFFFVHFKPTDSAGEDGDFALKVELIEAADRALPRLLDLGPDVLVVTGDHSTPATLRSHSWHPVPVLLWADTCRPDGVSAFAERACIVGGLGPRLPATDLLPLVFAHAGRFNKFGA